MQVPADPSVWDNFINAMNNGSGTPWAILFSAVVAFVAIFISGSIQRGIQRQILTFNNQSRLLWDKDYQENRQIFIEIREGDGDTLSQLAQDDRQSTPETAAIRTIVNDYELLAIGIKNRILDEKFIKEYYRSTLVRDCEMIMPYIRERRRVRGNQLLYIEYQLLARKWATPEQQYGLD